MFRAYSASVTPRHTTVLFLFLLVDVVSSARGNTRQGRKVGSMAPHLHPLLAFHPYYQLSSFADKTTRLRRLSPFQVSNYNEGSSRGLHQSIINRQMMILGLNLLFVGQLTMGVNKYSRVHLTVESDRRASSPSCFYLASMFLGHSS